MLCAGFVLSGGDGQRFRLGQAAAGALRAARANRTAKALRVRARLAELTHAFRRLSVACLERLLLCAPTRCRRQRLLLTSISPQQAPGMRT